MCAVTNIGWNAAVENNAHDGQAVDRHHTIMVINMWFIMHLQAHYHDYLQINVINFFSCLW